MSLLRGRYSRRGGYASDDLVTERKDGELHARLLCPVDYRHTPEVEHHVHRLLESGEATALHLDFSRVSSVDTTGLALIEHVRALGTHTGVPVSTSDVPHNAQAFLALAQERRERPTESPRDPGTIARLGAWAVAKWRVLTTFVEFLGRVLNGAARVVLRPRLWRPREILHQLQRGGSDAIPLVVGMSFLIGVIMAFQSRGPVVRFAGAGYMANAVAVMTAERMGPSLTAIIVASRSGTGYAAELGTMRAEAEIDALAVMGYDLHRYLVLPRVIALIVGIPMLAMIGNVAGIAGGLLVSNLMLDVPVAAYFAGVKEALAPHSIYGGVIRSVTFGVLIALIGCFLGLRAERGAESVGKQTTSAVVASVLGIIIADSAFATLFTMWGWGMSLAP